MKKDNYRSPEIEVMKMEAQNVICGSNVDESMSVGFYNPFSGEEEI